MREIPLETFQIAYGRHETRGPRWRKVPDEPTIGIKALLRKILPVSQPKTPDYRLAGPPLPQFDKAVNTIPSISAPLVDLENPHLRAVAQAIQEARQTSHS